MESYGTAHASSKQRKRKHLLWSKDAVDELVAIGTGGATAVWNLQDTAFIAERDHQDDLFGALENMDMDALPQASFCLRRNLVRALRIGKFGLLTLLGTRTTIQLFDLRRLQDDESPIWQRQLVSSAEILSILLIDASAVVHAVGREGSQGESLPAEVKDSLDLTEDAMRPWLVDQAHTSSKIAAKLPKDTKHNGMKPINIAALQVERAGFHKTSKQLQAHRPANSVSSSARPTTAVSEQSTATTMLAVSPNQKMTSSLELPNPSDSDDSPMPFLSPSVPARKPSPLALPAIDESLSLPPPSSEILGPSTPSAANDSDSDDETFDGNGMHGSGILMPGGANVPLPRSCGALFSPNGQLVAFFPPVLRPLSSKVEAAAHSGPESRFSKAGRIFPAFGNLVSDFTGLEEDSSDSDLQSIGPRDVIGVPEIDLQPPSFQSGGSWRTRMMTERPTLHHALGQRAVTVSVRNVDQLANMQSTIATQYRIRCELGESEFDICNANAEIADKTGSQDVSTIWLQAGELIKEQSSVDEDADIEYAVGPFAKTYQVNSQPQPSNDGLWASFETGNAWAVGQLFKLAEHRGDMPTLASLSAVFISASRAITHQKAEVATKSKRSSTYSLNDLRINRHGSVGQSHKSQPIPILRNHSQDAKAFRESPAKLGYGSTATSRNTSQPTTPYLDSLSSTPPYMFPNLSRQGSHLSTSGSASPEHHRSSFSAAAKYYAQSITDKFSSYGTSPPVKKLGTSTSPGNELSSSLPMAGGSWTKSVSFASKADTLGVSQHSRTTVPQEDDYDSDRTIEDTSQPQTPRSQAGSITFSFKQNTPIDAEPANQLQPLLSTTLLAKAEVWIHQYAEQLRSWNMAIEAAEMESVAADPDQKPAAASGYQGVLPAPSNGNQKVICSICECRINGLQQFCSRCLHSTHVHCLQSFVESCEEEEFECPTGCGCECSLVPYEEAMWEVEHPPIERSAAARRKTSFTDPRRWRARVEAESW